MTDRAQSLFGPQGEPCASCGAPLAADQRYCLGCGARRSTARLAFLDILTADAQAPQLVPFGTPISPVGAAVPPPPPPGGSFASQLRANTGIIAGVGVLLLAMLIGVLIGSGFGNDGPSASAASQRPQVIQVGAPAAAAPAATTPAATTTPTATTDASSSSGKSSSGAKSTSGGATNDSVKKLQSLSGKDYQKQVDKLGKKISTGGNAPPKDNKPAAGGGDFQDIG